MRSGGVLCHRREPTPVLKRSMENRTKGVYKAVPASPSLMDLSAQPASPQVESGYLTTFPTMGLGRTALDPRFWCFFSAEQEAVRRVLRETDNAGQREGGAGGEPI